MKLEPEEIEAIANAVASRFVDKVRSSTGKQFLPNVGQAGGSAEGGQTAAPEDRRVQTGIDLRAALNRGDRKGAVRLWQTWMQSVHLPATKKALHDEADQDHAEYYRWERGELPEGSQADRDIREVLLKPLS